MSDFNIQFEEQDQSITLEFEQIGGGAVKSVNGKVGEVVLGASDVGALPSSTSIPTVDATLSVTGAAADAKKTGDEITSLKEELNAVGNLENVSVNFKWEHGGIDNATGQTNNDGSLVRSRDITYYRVSELVSAVNNSNYPAFVILYTEADGEYIFGGNIKVNANSSVSFGSNVSAYDYARFDVRGPLEGAELIEVYAKTSLVSAVTSLVNKVYSFEKMIPLNLFSLDLKPKTSNGITITHTDGIITLNGTSTATIRSGIGSVYLNSGDYKLTGINHASIALQLLNSDNTAVIAQQQNGNDVSFTISTEGWYNLRIYIGNDITLTDELVYPMIRRAYISRSEFEPYGANDVAVWIGDSYVQANSLSSASLDQTKRFSTQVCKKMGWQEKNFAVGGMGFLYGDTPYLTQLQNAIADTTYDHYNVKKLFICGGRNDMSDSSLATGLTTAVNAVLALATTSFPNAEIVMIPMTYDYKTISQEGFFTYKTIIDAAIDYGVTVVGNAYMWLTGMKECILSDNVHPNVKGHTIIASHIINALNGGDSFPYPASLALDITSSKIDTSANNYCCLMQTHGEIIVNANFTLTEAAVKYDKLFSATVNSLNCPTYIGAYGKHIPIVNLDTGVTGVILVIDTFGTSETTTVFQAFTPLAAGTWKVLSAQVQFGVQEYSGNMT